MRNRRNENIEINNNHILIIFAIGTLLLFALAFFDGKLNKITEVYPLFKWIVTLPSVFLITVSVSLFFSKLNSKEKNESFTLYYYINDLSEFFKYVNNFYLYFTETYSKSKKRLLSNFFLLFLLSFLTTDIAAFFLGIGFKPYVVITNNLSMLFQGVFMTVIGCVMIHCYVGQTTKDFQLSILLKKVDDVLCKLDNLNIQLNLKHENGNLILDPNYLLEQLYDLNCNEAIEVYREVKNIYHPLTKLDLSIFLFKGEHDSLSNARQEHSVVLE